MEEKIISTSNPRIKNVLKLKEKSSERKLQDLIVVEGLREILMAKENGFGIKTLFVCEDIAGRKSKELVSSVSHLVKINKEVFHKNCLQGEFRRLACSCYSKTFTVKGYEVSSHSFAHRS
mgnify:CR=1 FL=1